MNYIFYPPDGKGVKVVSVKSYVTLFLCSLLYFGSQAQEPLWMISSNTEAFNRANDIVVDSLNQSIYACYAFIGPSTWEDQVVDVDWIQSETSEAVQVPVFGNVDTYLAKLDYDGNLLWIQGFGTSKDEEILSLTIGLDGNIYCTGYFENDISFTNVDGVLSTELTKVVPGNNDRDIFVLSFNPDGEILWAEASGGNQDDVGMDIEAGPNGLVVSGMYENDNALLCGEIPAQTTNKVDLCVLKYTWDGAPQWFITAGGNKDLDHAQYTYVESRIKLENRGDDYFLIGEFLSDSFEFYDSSNSISSAHTLSNPNGKENIFVLSFKDDGIINWTQSIVPSENPVRGYGIVSDCNGLYICGSSRLDSDETLTFPSGEELSSGLGDDMFVAKLNLETGQDEWTLLFPWFLNGQEDNLPFDLVTNDKGSLVMSGQIIEGFSFIPPYIDANISTTQSFIAEIKTDGSFVEGFLFGGIGNDAIYGSDLDEEGNLLLAEWSSENASWMDAISAQNDNAIVSKLSMNLNEDIDCCDDPAVTGTATISNEAPCRFEEVTLTLNNSYGDIQWQQSLDNGTSWTNISSVNSTSYSFYPESSALFRASLSTIIGCDTQYSNILTLTAPSNVLIACPFNFSEDVGDNCEFTIPNYLNQLGLNDCSISQLTQSPSIGTTVIPGSYQVSMMVTSTSEVICSFNLIVTDNAYPTITCPENINAFADINCQYEIPDFTTTSLADDNCNVSISQSPVPGTIIGTGIVDVVISASDNNGHTSNCTVTIEISDNIPPQLTCIENQELDLDSNCEAVLPNYTELIGYFDGCSDECIVTQTPAPGTLLVNNQEVIIQVSDNSGNTSQCSFDVTLVDNANPIVECFNGNQIVLQDGNCDFVVPDYNLLIASSDNCSSELSINQIPAPGDQISSSTEITFTVNDGQNETICSFTAIPLATIEISEIDCPGDQTVSLDDNCSFLLQDYTNLGTSNDLCNGVVVVQQSPPPGGVYSESVEVTLISSFQSVLGESCSFIVNPFDITNPNITCIGDQTLFINNDCEYIVPDFSALMNASDNCDTSLELQQIPAVGSIITSDTEVVLTYSDDAGNQSQCDFNLILDNNSLFALECTDIEELSGPTCSFIVPDYSDFFLPENICHIEDWGQSIAIGTTLVPGTYTMEFWANDDQGNNFTCSTNLIVNGNSAPQFIECPNEILIEASDISCSGIVPDMNSYIEVVDCSGNGNDFTITQSPSISESIDSGSFITVAAQDAEGQSGQCIIGVNVIDILLPQIDCSSIEQTEYVDEDCSYTVGDYTGMAEVSDNCGIFEITQSPLAGEVLDRSQNEITLIATDINGNTNSCQFELNIVDNIAPILAYCFEDGITSNGGNSCSSLLGNYTFMIATFATDNCDQLVSVTQSPASGTELSIGNHEVVFIASDDDGNTSTCSAIFEVLDLTIPELLIPNTDDFEIVLDGECEHPLEDYTGGFMATDLCNDFDEITFTQIPEPGTLINSDIEIIIIAEDPSGNSVNHSFDLVVDASQNYDITTDLESVTEYFNSSCEVDIGDYSEFIETFSFCDQAVDLLQVPSATTGFSGDPAPYMVFSIAGYDNIEVQVPYYVLDTISPSLFGYPDTLEIIADPITCSSTLGDLRASGFAFDNCTGMPSITQTPASGSPLELGPNEVIIEATDESNNSSSHTIIVNLIDTSAPVIIECVEDQFVSTDENCEFVVLDYSGMMEVEDNCGNSNSWTITQAPEEGDYVVGNQQVTMTVTDASGNSSECSFDIIVEDNTPPVIECPDSPIIVSANDNCEFTLEDLTQDVLVSDNCSDIIDVWQVQEVGSILNLGSNDVTLVSSDENSNESSCTVTVEVVDTSPPFADVEFIEITLVLNQQCEAFMPDLSEEFEFFDNCDSDLTFNQTDEPGAYVEIGSLLGAITVVDDNENTFILPYTIIVVDNTSPGLTACPEEMEVNVNESCSYTMPDYSGLVEYVDCTEVNVTQSPAANTIQTESQEVTLIFEDLNGNSSECSFWLNAVDNMAPELVCPESQTVYLLDDCNLILGSYVDVVTSSDNCEISYFEQSPTSDYAISPGEVLDVEISVFDLSENMSQCTFTLNFVDEIAPQIECGNDIEISVDNDLCGALVEFELPAFDDNCSNVDLIQLSGLSSGSEFPLGTTLMEYQVEDLSGNSTTCSYTINVVDDILPILVCPNPITTCEPLVFYDVPLVSDACGIDSTYQSDTSGLISGTEFPIGITNIEYTAIDMNGNLGVCSFTVEVAESVNADWGPIPELVCQGAEEIDFSEYVNSELDYFWTGDILDGVLNPETLEAGTYTVTLNVTSGDCAADSSQSITLEALPMVSLNPSIEICDLIVEIEASVSNGQIEWTAPPESTFLSDNISETVVVESSEYGSFDYWISASSENACTSEEMVTVTFYEAPSIPEAGIDQELFIQTETILEGEYFGVGQPTWSIIQGNAEISDSENLNSSVDNLSIGTNEFLLEVSNGVCPKEFDSVIILVHGLMIPSGFSPNGDMVNDYFEIKGIENWSDTPLKIFNRWGALVYENDNYRNDWNGESANGALLPDDTYFYILSIGITEYKGYLVIKK